MSLAVTASLLTSILTQAQGADLWYLYPDGDVNENSLPVEILISTGVWFIALMNFVPISMLVTLEMVNFIQAFYITVDIRVCDEPRGLQAGVQSSNLNEELGMVHYIFSDKTGTLTQNVMEFKRFSAGQYEYGCDDPKPFEYPSGVTNVNFEDPKFHKHIKDRKHENNINLKRFFAALGLCHTVICDTKTDK